MQTTTMLDRTVSVYYVIEGRGHGLFLADIELILPG